MATYVNYAERNAADQVDWSAIGSSISKTLLDERDRREKAKKDIADASNAYAETLANAPMGQSKGINDFTLEFANNAEQFRLMQNRMLESGRMKLKDYNIGRANLMSGTQQLFNLSKEYNAVYDEKMKRMQDKESQAFETWAMGNIEGYSNFNNSGGFIDPTTGKVAVAKKIKKTLSDGTIVYEISKSPNDFKSVNELRNIINVKYNRFKVSENLQSEVDKMGEYVDVLMKDGVKTLEDAKKSPEYQKVRNEYINSIIETNPDDVMSILTNYLGAVVDKEGKPGDAFDFTYDPDEAATSEKWILMKKNEQTDRFEADFSTANGKKQKEMARKALQSKFDSMVDVKETAMPFQRKSPYDQKSEQQAVIDKQGVEAWAGLYFGTPEEQKGFADRLLGSPNSRRQGLVEIDTRTKPGTFILKYKDKTKNREIDVLDDEGNALPYGDYIALGNEIHGIDDYGRALELSGRKDATYSTERGGRSRRKGSRKAYNSVDNQVNYRGEKINADNIIEEKIEENVADKEAINVIKDVFEIQDLPTPNIEIEPGGREITPSSTRVIPGVSVGGYTPAERTKPSIKISVPGVTDAPIYIPEGEGMKEVLDKAIALIDQAYDNNNLLTPEDFKAIFPTENIFLEYNPKQPDAEESTKSEESSGTGKKQLPGKKQ